MVCLLRNRSSLLCCGVCYKVMWTYSLKTTSSKSLMSSLLVHYQINVNSHPINSLLCSNFEISVKSPLNHERLNIVSMFWPVVYNVQHSLNVLCTYAIMEISLLFGFSSRQTDIAHVCCYLLRSEDGVNLLLLLIYVLLSCFKHFRTCCLVALSLASFQLCFWTFSI